MSDELFVYDNGYRIGMACAPKAPRTAEATAITILRSLSHQEDFIDIRFKFLSL